MFLAFFVVFLQGLFGKAKPKPVITIPNKPESTCGAVKAVESTGNRIVPACLILLSLLFCLADVIR